MKIDGGSETIIRNIVGRLHVSATDDEVRNEVLGKLRGADERTKKAVAKKAVAIHHGNQVLYKRVVAGRF